MSSMKRSSGESYKALGDLNSFLEDWALENAGKLRRSCASCVYAVKDGPFKCSLYNMVPPINVIMDGCSDHNDNDAIPF